jgi:hypothetical protein
MTVFLLLFGKSVGTVVVRSSGSRKHAREDLSLLELRYEKQTTGSTFGNLDFLAGFAYD